MTYLGRSYGFKFFKGCAPQILFGPFLNTLFHMFLAIVACGIYTFKQTSTVTPMFLVS